MLRASHSNQPEEIAKKRALREAHLAEEKQLAAERDFEQIVEIFRPPPRASVRLDPGSTSEVQFEGLLNKPLNLAEEEQGGYVIEDFEKTPIFLPDEGDCPIPPEWCEFSRKLAPINRIQRKMFFL